MSDISETGSHNRYVAMLALVWALLCTATLVINLLVDPLWYWKGNQLTGKNFRFNERDSKLNHVLANRDTYDCLIFGSSRATFLQPDSFDGFRCFNFAFSSGQPVEFIAFARYLKFMGVAPRLIVVGVDGFTFHDEGRDPPDIPAYVLELTDPPGVLERYMTVDALEFSLRTLANRSPLPSYYTSRFYGAVRENAPIFRPEISLEAEGLRREDDASRHRRPFNPGYASYYGELRKVFPEARFLGYVPPISAWHIARLDRYGVLDGYLGALHSSAEYFDEFWDFSVPSEITWRPENTYDGSHYSVDSNRAIANAMTSAQATGIGLRVSKLDLSDYKARFVSRLAAFRAGSPQLAAREAQAHMPVEGMGGR